MTKYLYPPEYTNRYYCKRGSPDYSWDEIIKEVDKDPDLIRKGEHPHIGYREDDKPITDAWWM